VLTAEPDPDEPVDLTGEGFVTGTGDRFAGGVTAAAGKSKTAVRTAAATPTGTGTATRAPVGPAAPTVDLSRPASPGSGSNWDDCGFPPEADQEGINSARVTIAVTVKPDGRARSVTVLKDFGYGFGALARSCAMRKVLTPALNRFGQPVEQTTAPFTVRFTR
jgi:protein TonB